MGCGPPPLTSKKTQFLFTMTEWAEPRDFKEWGKRILGWRPLLTLILISCILILELRFDWMERILGAYLASLI